MNSTGNGSSCKVCNVRCTERSHKIVCLVCENYILCKICHAGKKCNEQHWANHPMQMVMHGHQTEAMENFCCPYCGENKFNQKSLLQHCDRYHRTLAENVKCPICVAYDENQKEVTDLALHLTSEHQSICCSVCSDVLLYTSRYTCLQCDATFLCNQCYEQKCCSLSHKPYHSMQFSPETNDTLSQTELCCSYCDFKTIHLNELKKHCFEYHRVNCSMLVRCPVCVMQRLPNSASKRSLHEHLELHTLSAASTTQVQECAICMEDSTINDRTLPCGHRFHVPCITDWSGHHNTCPVCRTKYDAS